MAEPSPRSRHFSAVVEDKLCVWGGDGGFGKSVVTSIVHHYDPDSETWNTNTCEGPHPPGIEGGACASAGHHLYTYGGWDEGVSMQGTLHPNRSLPVVQLKEAGRAATRESWRAPRELERPSEKKRRVRRGVCFAFNEGVCKFGPDCRFDHQCTVCKVYGDHGAAQCKEEGGRRRGQQ